jgi:MFS family permease
MLRSSSESDLQWFSSGYFLVLAAAMLPAGLLGDRYGRKKVLLIALGLFRGGIGGVCVLDLGRRVPGRPVAGRAGRGPGSS